MHTWKYSHLSQCSGSKRQWSHCFENYFRFYFCIVLTSILQFNKWFVSKVFKDKSVLSLLDIWNYGRYNKLFDAKFNSNYGMAKYLYHLWNSWSLCFFSWIDCNKWASKFSKITNWSRLKERKWNSGFQEKKDNYENFWWQKRKFCFEAHKGVCNWIQKDIY